MSARKLVWAIVVIGIVGVVIGCGRLQQMSEEAKKRAVETAEEVGEQKPAPAQQQQQQQPPQPVVTPMDISSPLADEAKKVLVRKTEEFVYDPINRVDPFQPLKPQVTAEGTRSELPQTEYMGRYELRALKLVAVVWGAVEPRAMFETPDGKAYSVKVGDLFSKDAAEVLSITSEGVLVKVASRTLTGEVSTQKVMIKLKPEEQEREETESFLGFGGGYKRNEVKPEGY